MSDSHSKITNVRSVRSKKDKSQNRSDKKHDDHDDEESALKSMHGTSTYKQRDEKAAGKMYRD
jgi:hypothetical protein